MRKHLARQQDGEKGPAPPLVLFLRPTMIAAQDSRREKA